MTKIVLPVEFTFEIGENINKALQSASAQIGSDLNEYWQSDSEDAQMTQIKIKEHWELV